MFTVSKFNRKLDNEPGSSGGDPDVILSGFSDDEPGSGQKSGSPTADGGFIIDDDDDPKGGKPKGGTGDGGGSDDPAKKPDNSELSELKDLSPIASDFLSTKYGDDLELLRLDKEGNVTNIDGEVLVTKDDYEKGITKTKETHVEKAKDYIKSLETFRVEDEDGKYYDAKINENGELVDDDGNVVMSADELVDSVIEEGDYVDYDPNEEPIYDSANKITGFEFTDDEGNPVEFDETPEGLAARDLHLVQTYGIRTAQEQINKFFQENPHIEDFYNYVKVNGSPEGYGNQTSHENITIDKDNESQHFNLVVEAEMLRGNTRERAENIAEMFKEKDKLFEEAENSLSFIVGKEKESRQQRKEAVIAQQQEEQANKEAHANNVKEILERGKVLDYTIPKNIKVKDKNGIIRTATVNDFFEYVTQDTGNGLTRSQLDAKNEDLEYKLLIDYLRFTGNDIDYLVNQKSNQKAVNSFKSKFTKSKGRVPKATVKVKKNTSNSNDDIIY